MSKPPVLFQALPRSDEYFETLKLWNCKRFTMRLKSGKTARGLITEDSRAIEVVVPGGSQTRITFSGVRVYVWHPTIPTVNAVRTIQATAARPDLGITPKQVEAAKKAALADLTRVCQHKKATLVKWNKRLCLRTYHCTKCGERFEIDSSG